MMVRGDGIRLPFSKRTIFQAGTQLCVITLIMQKPLPFSSTKSCGEIVLAYFRDTDL